MASLGKATLESQGTFADKNLMGQLLAYRKVVAANYVLTSSADIERKLALPLLVSTKLDGELWFLLQGELSVVILSFWVKQVKLDWIKARSLLVNFTFWEKLAHELQTSLLHLVQARRRIHPKSVLPFSILSRHLRSLR
jgi:hypothetical protein